MNLLQYTSGVAKDTIQCLFVQGSIRDPSLGYQTARKVLEERFGHPFRIASSGLLPFADQLKDCEHTLEFIDYLDEINFISGQNLLK